jgi:hypothetical protein
VALLHLMRLAEEKGRGDRADVEYVRILHLAACSAQPLTPAATGAPTRAGYGIGHQDELPEQLPLLMMLPVLQQAPL